MSRSYAITSNNRGVNQSVDPSLVDSNELVHAVNMQVKGGLLQVRDGISIKQISGVSGKYQGGIFYDPKKGQACVSQSDDDGCLAIAVGGNIHKVCLDYDPCCKSDDQVAGEFLMSGMSKDVDQVWLTQAENLLVASDGVSKVKHWNGKESVTNDGLGCNSDDDSSVPEGSGLGVYAHGRLLSVFGNNHVAVSNMAYSKNLTEPVDVVNFTEQITAASGRYLSPPTNVGNIVAGDILISNGSVHGHTVVALHGQCGGVYGVDIGKAPRRTTRSEDGEILERGWDMQQMTSHILTDSSAIGARALASVVDDHIFRSVNGVESLRSVQQANQYYGNMPRTLSERARGYIDDNGEEFPHTISLKLSRSLRKLYVSSNTTENGAKSWVSMSMDIVDGEQRYIWEGLGTLPDGYKILEFIPVKDCGRERFVAIVSKGDHLFVAQFVEGLKHDILPNGESKEIEWQVVSGLIGGNETFSKNWTGYSLFFKDVKNLTFDTKLRTNNSPDWKDGISDCIECESTLDYQRGNDSFPPNYRSANWVQFIVRGRGWAKFSFLTADYDKDTTDQNRKKTSHTCPTHLTQFNLLSYHGEDNCK